MKRFVCTVLFIALSAVIAALPAGAAVTLELDQSIVDVSAFYNGTEIHASGTVPPGNQVVVLVSGEPEDLHLKKKGKAGGVFWMNVGDLTYENAPAVYMVYGTSAVEEFLDAPELPFSLKALEARVKITPAGDDKDFLFREFVKLKEHDAVYAVRPGSVTMTDDGAFNVPLRIPPRMKPATYKVSAFALQDGTVRGTAETQFVIRLVGFPSFLSRMAFDKSLIYGILAVVIAVAAGLIMGSLFKGGGGGH